MVFNWGQGGGVFLGYISNLTGTPKSYCVRPRHYSPASQPQFFFFLILNFIFLYKFCTIILCSFVNFSWIKEICYLWSEQG